MKKFAPILAATLLLGITSSAFADTNGNATANAKIQSQASLQNPAGDKMDISGGTDVNASGSVSTPGGKLPFMRLNGSLNGSASGSSTRGAGKGSNSTSTAISKANTAIADRIASLTKLQSKVDAMVKLSASEKARLDASIQASITDMNNLKVKIDADTDVTVLKTDIASITGSYRIYMLVIPQADIAAADDRIDTIVGMMTTVAGKFQTRISAAAAAGKDTTSLSASLSDYNAKIADAKVQADAAASSTISLTPDNHNATIAAANKQVLQAARAKIKAAVADLNAARADANTIIKGLKAFGNIGVSASSTATTTAK